MSTEELIAKAIHDVDCPDVPHCQATPTTWSRYHRFAAASVAALSGRLLPEGGATRTEWRVIYRDGLDQKVVWSARETASTADESLREARRSGWPGAALETRSLTSFPDGSSYVGPWSEVTP